MTKTNIRISKPKEGYDVIRVKGVKTLSLSGVELKNYESVPVPALSIYDKETGKRLGTIFLENNHVVL